MIAVQIYVVDPISRARDTLAALELFGIFGAHAALTRKLALAVRPMMTFRPRSAVFRRLFSVFTIVLTL